jgi:hypothetical protein
MSDCHMCGTNCGDTCYRPQQAPQDIQGTRYSVDKWLSEQGLVALDKDMLRHLVQVGEAVKDLCQPKMRQAYDDPTEHDGGLALSALSDVINTIAARTK